MSITAVANPATDRQISFLTKLFTEAQSALAAAAEEGKAAEAETASTALAAHADVIAAVLGQVPADRRDVSAAIDTLIKVKDALVALSAPVLPGIPGRARIVIKNKFPKRCEVCAESVPLEEGWSFVFGANDWHTVCAACAAETAEARQERLAAQRAQEEAQRAQRVAEEAAKRAAEDAFAREIQVLASDLFARLGTDVNAVPAARLAIPSATGNNDLDFFRIQTSQKTGLVAVLRVIGGHADQPLSVQQSHAALVRLACTEDVAEAAKTYTRKIGSCAWCGRHLTDESSRDRGLGPDCAAKFGF